MENIILHTTNLNWTFSYDRVMQVAINPHKKYNFSKELDIWKDYLVFGFPSTAHYHNY